MKRKVSKPRRLELFGLSFWYDEELNFIRINLSAIGLTEAKRLHKWLGKVILYLEDKNKDGK